MGTQVLFWVTTLGGQQQTSGGESRAPQQEALLATLLFRPYQDHHILMASEFGPEPEY